jgi:hypothetical protein
MTAIVASLVRRGNDKSGKKIDKLGHQSAEYIAIVRLNCFRSL